eukprot:6152462-Prymnesium_polylepis.1
MVTLGLLLSPAHLLRSSRGSDPQLVSHGRPTQRQHIRQHHREALQRLLTTSSARLSAFGALPLRFGRRDFCHRPQRDVRALLVATYSRDWPPASCL